MGRVRHKGEPARSIFEVLMLEHRDVRSLFDQIQAVCADDPAAASDLFTVLQTSLLAHARAEEAVPYVRFAEIDGLVAEIGEARQDHALVETLLRELAARPPDGDEWLAELIALEEEVEQHVVEEEGVVFPAAMQEIDAAESRRLASRYLQRKARLTGEPARGPGGKRAPAQKGSFAAR